MSFSNSAHDEDGNRIRDKNGQFKIMALEITGMTRSFTFKKGSGMITLDDPNPSDSPEMVMSYYSNFYPELTTATVHGPVIKNDKAVYEFKTTIGTKG